MTHTVKMCKPTLSMHDKRLHDAGHRPMEDPPHQNDACFRKSAGVDSTVYPSTVPVACGWTCLLPYTCISMRPARLLAHFWFQKSSTLSRVVERSAAATALLRLKRKVRSIISAHASSATLERVLGGSSSSEAAARTTPAKVAAVVLARRAGTEARKASMRRATSCGGVADCTRKTRYVTPRSSEAALCTMYPSCCTVRSS
mmetsp:Transcript_40248/g.99753  ORF Transcript_40248/g.99753 Transcript_40248/m.99753 type:complete len:201 (+) Transcript_40248:86-688(+)